MVNFVYQSGRCELDAGVDDPNIREIAGRAQAFVDELRTRLGKDDGETPCLRRLVVEDDSVEMTVCSEEMLRRQPEKFLQKDYSIRLYQHFPKKGTVMLRTIGGFGSVVREYKKGVLEDLVGNGDRPEDVLFRLLKEKNAVPETLSVVTEFWIDLRDLGVEDDG